MQHRLFAERPQGPAWIRKVRVEMPTRVINRELDARPSSAVELWTSIIVEGPGFPPIAGVAAEVHLEDPEAEYNDVSLWYYTFSEVSGPKVYSEAFQDGRRYHEAEELVDFPDWVTAQGDDAEVAENTD
jgi:hypothetical protein